MKTLRWFYCLGLAVFLGFFPRIAQAHTQSCAYLTIQTTEEGLTGELHLALRDLDDAVDLDVNDDGAITWGELRSRKEAVCAYALSRLHIDEDDQKGVLRVSDFLVDNHSDGSYAVMRFAVQEVARPKKVQIAYNALFDIDPKHRGLLHLVNNGNSRLVVFSPDTSVQTFDLDSKVAVGSPFFTFLKQGIWHIWSGYDHILFLLALLLPGVLRRKDGVWLPVNAARPALINILKIVTAFTVAHSITLSLSVLGIVHLPSRLVESAIAASVILAAFNNLMPIVAERGWMVAFAFGLLHGFGFANALRDVGLPHAQLAATLFGFNLGVEIGQLAIVAVFFPIALSLRKLLFYQRFVLRFGSAAIILVSATWFAERVFDFKWLPF